MVDLILKKRNGLELTWDEYSEIIDGLISGRIPDYQISAFLMATYFQGMTESETAILTEVMMHSGKVVDLSEIPGIKVDKHSSGGVGDKTTLVLTPLVAAAGVPIAKMTGRGLGHTGGTMDKLESIKGFNVNLSIEQFISNIKTHGIAICGQNENLVPADKKLYALRDVTATVDNISLIASSIMSKKLASGADAILLDIKVGEGAYMKSLERAEELAKLIKDIGSRMKKEVIVVITDMNQPLGNAVGNALEVKEAIDTLKGEGPADLTGLCLALGAKMLMLGQVVQDYSKAIELLKSLISNGKAFEKFKEFVKAQGGDVSVIEHPELLPSDQYSQAFKCDSDGYITGLNALDVGLASVKLGAGRETMNSPIDHGAGIILKRKIGEFVKKDEEVAMMYTNHKSHFDEAVKFLKRAYIIRKDPPVKKPLILKTMM